MNVSALVKLQAIIEPHMQAEEGDKALAKREAIIAKPKNLMQHLDLSLQIGLTWQKSSLWPKRNVFAVI